MRLIRAHVCALAITALVALLAGCGQSEAEAEAEVEKEVYSTAYRIGDVIGARYARDEAAFHACADTRDEEAWLEWSTEIWYLDGCSDGVHGRGNRFDE